MVIWLSSDSDFRVLKAKYIVFLSYKNLEFFLIIMRCELEKLILLYNSKYVIFVN